MGDVTKSFVYDLRIQPKKFLEGDWQKLFESQFSQIKETHEYAILIVNATNADDFKKLMDKMGREYTYYGSMSEWRDASEMSITPANGEVYRITL